MNPQCSEIVFFMCKITPINRQSVPVVGGGFYQRQHLAGTRVCGVHHRCTGMIVGCLLPLITDLIRCARQTGTTDLLGELKEQSTVSRYVRGLCARLKHEEHWSAHDLRRSMQTHAAD